MTRWIAIVATLGFCMTACSKPKPKPEPEAKVEVKKEQKSKGKSEKKKKKKKATLSPLEPKTALGEIPTAADLEKEAEQTIALENLESELDRLEAEIVGLPN